MPLSRRAIPAGVATIALAMLGLALLSTAPPARAAYSRRWWVLAGGGAIPTSNAATGYRVSGTIGQPLVGVRRPGAYTVVNGFWSGPVGSAFVGIGDPAAPPRGFSLASPAPNPARGVSTIAFALPAAAEVSVRVLDLQGRLVRTLAHGRLAAGAQRLAWDGRDDAGGLAPRGLYFVHVDAGTDHGVARIVRLTDGGAR